MYMSDSHMYYACMDDTSTLNRYLKGGLIITDRDKNNIRKIIENCIAICESLGIELKKVYEIEDIEKLIEKHNQLVIEDLVEEELEDLSDDELNIVERYKK